MYEIGCVVIAKDSLGQMYREPKIKLKNTAFNGNYNLKLNHNRPLKEEYLKNYYWRYVNSSSREI